MTIQEFAEKYRLKICRDSCGDPIIAGKKLASDMPERPEYHSHVYEGFADGRLGLCLMYPHVKRWNATQRRMLVAEFIRKQGGETEGCYSFDPEAPAQARLALSLAGIRAKRINSSAQLAALAKGRVQFVAGVEKQDFPDTEAA